MLTHISKNLAGQIVDSIKDICGHDINYIDQTGHIIASTNPNRIGHFHELAAEVVKTRTPMEVTTDHEYSGTQKGVNLPILHKGEIVGIIGISGEPDEVRKYAYLAERITRLLIREQELGALSHSRSEKMNFIIQSLITNQTPNRQYLTECLSEFHLKEEDSLRLIYIRLNKRYNTTNLSMMEENITQLFTTTNLPLHAFQYPYDYLCICHDGDWKKVERHFISFAATHEYLLKIGVGSACPLSKLSYSYQTSQIALQSITTSEQSYACFDSLTLEILLGDTSSSMRNEYLKKTISQLNVEDCHLLRMYYELEMSLDKTSKQLYLHKNTVQYKLDRIFRITGFNPRSFQDAVVLYIALQCQQLFP